MWFGRGWAHNGLRFQAAVTGSASHSQPRDADVVTAPLASVIALESERRGSRLVPPIMRHLPELCLLCNCSDQRPATAT
ncbi:hypothetical protein SAMN05519103_06697 [Rhizobiales bacterium GAS113]|nr:hypothetical protein SAMN05519103_06697 [Rhizobiales bacterium GAS113]SED68873.1 hypothetical protein SAMN05519104_4096 [Rhizobiales bacterium GAS188]